MKEIEIEFLEWVHPQLGVTAVKVEGDKPLVLKARIKEALVQPEEAQSALSLFQSGFIDGREKGLKEALAQPEQEPVAGEWVVLSESVGKLKELGWNDDAIHKANTPQRTWVGLTDWEIYEATKDVDKKPLRVIVDLLEAKLKEKNT